MNSDKPTKGVSLPDINAKEILRSRRKLCLFILSLLYLIPPIAHQGFITSNNISITLLHIPVIIVTIFLGLFEGLFTGLLFGLSSMEIASVYPTSEIDSLFTNPLLSITPRVIMPVIVWIIYKLLTDSFDDNSLSAKIIINAFTAMCGTLTNTFLVLIALCTLYPQKLNVSDDISFNNIIAKNMLGLNVQRESMLAMIITIVITVVYYKLYTKKKNDVSQKPLKNTFQKWLFLFMVSAFFILFLFIYIIMTGVEYKRAITMLLEKTDAVTITYKQLGKDIESSELRLSNNGVVVIVKKDIIIKSGEPSFVGKPLSSLITSSSGFNKDTYNSGQINDSDILYMCRNVDDVNIIAYMPFDFIYSARNGVLTILFVGLILIFIAIFKIISKLLKKNIVDKIDIINNSLSIIRGGNLDETINVRNNYEFKELSLGINTTVAALKETMEQIDNKNRQEREFAREIQYSSLPISEYFQSEKGLYEIWGSMNTAEEVGGDFYDYYLLDDNRLGFVIADVSGKGVPAALFMMTSKTLIKDLILSGKTPAETLELANIELCKNNEKGMFVTVWLGIVDFDKNTLTFANAGHNPPVFIKNEKELFYMDHTKYKRSLMLGFMPATKYTDNVIDISSGDMLLLYTDGVTEAHNTEGELYGEDRLIKCIDNNRTLNVKELLAALKDDVDTFSQNAEQFDDITMVSFKYN